HTRLSRDWSSDVCSSDLVFLLLMGVAQGLIGAAVVLAVPWKGGLFSAPAGWAFLSGLLWGTGGVFLIHVLHRQEVSRTVPVFQKHGRAPCRERADIWVRS